VIKCPAVDKECHPIKTAGKSCTLLGIPENPK